MKIGIGHQVNDLGYGKTVEDATMGNLQPSSKGLMAYGRSSQTKWQWALYELKI